MATIALHPPTEQLRPWLRRMVRLGHAADGVVYMLVGGLALQVVLGDGGRITDKQGVLGEILGLPFGTPMLALVGSGLLAIALWRITGGFVAPGAESGIKGAVARVMAIVEGLMYGVVGWQAVRIVIGAGRTRLRGAEGYARDVMQLPLGDWALVLIGLGIVIVGGYQVWLAATSRFDDDMDQRHLRREGMAWVLHIGRAGIAARGVVFVSMGVLLARAGFERRPSEAGGLADSLMALLSQPFGTVLLGAAAAGLMCYGVWQMLHARYVNV